MMELADRRAEQERQAGIRAATFAVSAPGCRECVDCDEEIDADRRRAYPAARRCLGCQTRFERKRGSVS